MGGKTISTTETRLKGVHVQTSAYGGALSIVFGTQRVSGNLIWYGNFKAIAHTTTSSGGGKGFGKSKSKNTTFTYSAAVQVSLCEGTIVGVGAVWKGKEKTTLAALGLTLFTGVIGQSAWSFRVGYNSVPVNIDQENAYGFYDQIVNFSSSTVAPYSGTAYLAASAYDLGGDASVPNHGFEVQGLAIYGSGILDANPKDIATLMLSNAQFGAGFPSGLIGSLTQFDAYCRAAGMFFSPAYTSQRPAADHLSELTDGANTALVWSDGVLKFVPYGDATLTGNGVTYTPNVTALYDLNDDNFLGNGDDPVTVTRTAPADAYNRVQVEYLDRVNQYNTAIVSVEDQAAIELYGLRIAPVQQAHFVADGTVATVVAQLALQRGLYKRNAYSFSLPASFALLEPMDIVTLTTGDMVRVAVRITNIDEDGDDFALIAEDFPLGVASAALYAHDAGLRYQANLNAAPQSCADPVIFEMPADPSATGLSIAIAVGGQTGDSLYGGCHVWLSLDGANYKKEGTISGSSRYGLTTAALAAASIGINATNTLSVALRANGQIISGSGADVAQGTTLIVVDGEYLAYQTATLTGTNAYNLTTLNRGLYNTLGLAHASGVAWVRVDDAIAVLRDLDLKLIGQTIYIKLTAFNTFEGGEQDLSTVTAYTYTITGDMKALQTPVDFATRVGGAAKPANNATRNVVTYSTTAPTTPVDGDLWVDLSGTFAIFKLRSGGAWAIGANALSVYNTLSGKPIALADISTTESNKLAGIAAGATVGAVAGTNLTRADGTLISNADNSQITVSTIGVLTGAGSSTVVGNNQMRLGRVTRPGTIRMLRDGAGLDFYDIDLVGDTVIDNSTQQWSAVSGTGRPADSATVGAQSGVNLKDYSGFVLSDADIKNIQISVNAATGGLSGIGTGNGTIVDNTYAISGNNLLPNSNATQVCNWARGYSPNGSTFDVNPEFAKLHWASDSYSLGGTDMNNMVIHQSNVAPGSSDGSGDTAVACDIYPQDANSANISIPVIAGEKVFASVYLDNHRCSSFTYLAFFNSSGTPLAYVQGNVVGNASALANTLSTYDRSVCGAIAPAGVAYATMFIRKLNTIAGNTESYTFWAAPQLEKTNLNQTTASPYSPGPASSVKQLGYSGDLNATLGANRRNLPQVFGGGAQLRYSVQPLSTGSATDTIYIAAHTVGDGMGTAISYGAGSIAGLAAGGNYAVYEDDPTYAGGTRTYLATTDRSVLVANSGRRWLGDIYTPASVGAATPPPTGGGAGGGAPSGNPLP
jgi:hypothetical protein